MPIPEWLLICIICLAWVQGGMTVWGFMRVRHRREVEGMRKDLKEVADNAHVIYAQLQQYRAAEQMLRAVAESYKATPPPGFLN